MDTKYFHAALEEAYKQAALDGIPNARELSIADLTLGDLSQLLFRAQELKDAAAAARAEEVAGESAEESARRTR